MRYLRKGAVLQSRFVLIISNQGEPTEEYKPRLVILGHIDPDKPRIVNEAPTVMRSSVRLAITLIASHNFQLWSRDITLAFLKSKDELQRDIYVRMPKGENLLEHIGAPPGSILKAVKPQYGLAESPGYWWQTFRHWHVSDLNMSASALDPCLFYKTNTQGLEGIQVTQVDDTCGGGNETFAALEAEKSLLFNCKPRTTDFPMKFNGLWIERFQKNGYLTHQNDYGESVSGN